MDKVLIIARMTLLESVRRQVFLVTLFLGVIIVVVPGMVNVFGLGASERVAKDVGLTLIGYYGVLLALLFGSTAVPGEIERKTIYPILTRPLPRRAYLWGKWLGLMAFIGLSLSFLALCLIGSSAVFLPNPDFRILTALVCYLAETGVLLAACIFFSTFCSPPLAGVLGAFIYLVGGLPHAFVEYVLINRGVVNAWVVRIMQLFFPHFQFFHVKDAVVHGADLPMLYVITVIAYGLAWVVMGQLLAEWFFERKDLLRWLVDGRGWIFLLTVVLLLSGVRPGFAAPVPGTPSPSASPAALPSASPAAAPSPAPVVTHDDNPENEANHLPIQVYYHRAFFSQPWRVQGEYKNVAEQTAGLIVVEVLLVAILRWRRRR